MTTVAEPMTNATGTSPGTQLTAPTTERVSLGLLRPIASPGEVVKAQEAVREYVAKTLQKDRDYGVIPGTNKPTLLKPGAERVCNGFGLTPKFDTIDAEVDHDRIVKWAKRKKVWRNHGPGDRSFDWKMEDGESIGLYRYVVRCTLTHRESGEIVADACGSASTLEAKYIDRPRECENTVLKMASKRAYIAATLLAVGLSDQFTQDMEDMSRDAGEEEPEPPPVVVLATRNDKIDFGTKWFGKTVADLTPDELKWANEKPDARLPERWRVVFRSELENREDRKTA